MSEMIEKVGELLEKLQSPDFYIREEAVNALGSCDEEEAVAGLVIALEDSDLGIRELAADYLIKINNEIAYHLLIKFLGSEDIGSRNLASEILVKIGSDAVPALIGEINNDDHDVRKFVVDILGLIRDEQALEAICTKLEDNNINVICSAAEALGEIGSPKAVSQLIESFKRTEDVRLPAIEALGKIGDTVSLDFLYNCLTSTDPMILFATIEAIGNIGDENSVEFLLKFLEGKDITIAEATLSAIVNIASHNNGTLEYDLPLDRFSGFLFDGIKKKNKKLTQFTLNRLKHWYGQDILRSLLEVLQYVDEEELSQVVKMLGDIGPSARNVIIEKMETATTDLKLIYLNILKEYKDPSIAKKLIKFKDDGDPHVRRTVAYLLGMSGDNNVIETLKIMTSDSLGHVRSAAYAALGWLCSEKDIDFLFEGLNDKYQDVREAVMGALVLIGTDDVVRRFNEDLYHPEVERQRLAATALGLIGDTTVVEPLLQAINHPESSIRKSAIDSLAKIRDVEDIGALLLALNDENSGVRKSAISALYAIRGEEIIRDMRFLLDDEDVWVKYHLINLIGETGNEKYSAYLKNFLECSEDILKIAAVKSLSKIKCKDMINEIARLKHDKNQDLAQAAEYALEKLQEV